MDIFIIQTLRVLNNLNNSLTDLIAKLVAKACIRCLPRNHANFD